MDVNEAIFERCSIRSFRPDPVPKETVLKIIEIATHAPSALNTQPWEIIVVGGTTLETIRKSYLDRFSNNITGQPEIKGTNWGQLPSSIQERIAHMRAERSKLEGLYPQNPESMRIHMERGARLFGAPVVLILCMNRAFSIFSTFDLGLFSQSIVLTAQNFGIGSIIASAIVVHPDILRNELTIPDDLLIVEGIALGYPDDSIINTFRSLRRPVQEVAVFKGL